MATSRGLAGLSTILSTKVQSFLLYSTWFDNHLCAVRLNGSVRTKRNGETRCCLCVISAHAPTDCSSNEVKDEFYRKLSSLLLEVKCSDMVVVEGHFNAQLGRLTQTERHLHGTFGIPVRLLDEHMNEIAYYDCAQTTVYF
ncbi:unnamed protein product [Heterobilharzia americana]|nr:unnamed protein product [Heterobilharzia americana]